MSAALSIEAILKHIAEREKEYDWLGAAETCKNGLELLSKQDFSAVGELHERLGYAFRRAAMQAENANEFKDRMSKATENYCKARESYAKLNGGGKTPMILRCEAMIAYIGYWLAHEVPEKKRFLNESWKLAKDSLKAFEEARERCEYGRSYSQLSSAAIFIFTFEPDFKSREKAMREAVEYGEKAISYLSDCGDPYELAGVCAKTVVCLGVFGYYFQDVPEREKYREKGLEYWARARELSEEAALAESIYPVFGCQPFFGLEGTGEALANYEKALEYGRKMKDKFIVGCALDWLAYHTAWKIHATDSPDESARLIEKVVQYAEEAKRQFSVMSFLSPRGDVAWIEGMGVEYLLWLSDSETDLKKRRDLHEKALQASPDLVRRGEVSGYPEITAYLHSGQVLLCLQSAKFEANSNEKKRLLEEALAHSNENFRIVERLEPFIYWNRGIARIQLSNIKSELANLTREPETRKALLQEALTNKEDAIELLIKELAFFEYHRKGSATSLFSSLGGNQSGYGDLLVHLYELNSDKELLRKAVKAYEDATASYQRLNLSARIAESDWRKARVYDTLGEYLTASQNFDLAASNYKSVSEKTAQLKDFYTDHALYMQAWSEVEKARYRHDRQEYGLAEEHFKNAANMHKPLKQWNYLAPNYFAWAQLDHAEELSRKENSEEALQAFELATQFFEETRKSLQNELDKTEDSEEKQMIERMLKATDIRHQYCMGRIAVEEAKILDKKGDHHSSSEKYGSAAQMFGRIEQAVDSERDRKEFDLITALSQAWAKMTMAEAEESPGPYIEASQLFEKAKELSQNEKAKTLALGHSRFCRALEAGMKFADTGDVKLHATALQHLESAAKYYVKAGFQNASEYAKATELLLDGYLDINSAKKEPNPEKKAKLFTMAEKVLQTSAGSFMKAEHPEKREQVLRFLEKVKEERELAMSLNEILHTPSLVSTTNAFATPMPSQENAVGLERFENANIQANIVARQKQLKVGENLDLEIELINAGKGPALLIKITEIIPSGFELTEKPEIYRIEDSYLNMKGRRIDPLKTEEIKLTLRPKIQGEFALKPTVLYLDENGKYKSHEPEPVSITVKELGIKGWIKG